VHAHLHILQDGADQSCLIGPLKLLLRGSAQECFAALLPQEVLCCEATRDATHRLLERMLELLVPRAAAGLFVADGAAYAALLVTVYALLAPRTTLRALLAWLCSRSECRVRLARVRPVLRCLMRPMFPGGQSVRELPALLPRRQRRASSSCARPGGAAAPLLHSAPQADPLCHTLCPGHQCEPEEPRLTS